MKRAAQNDLTIIDEFGYIPSSPDAIPCLFEFIVNVCYERQSLIMTSNLSFAEWMDSAGAHEKMAHAIIDRVVHNTFLVKFVGASRRVLQSPMNPSI